MSASTIRSISVDRSPEGRSLPIIQTKEKPKPQRLQGFASNASHLKIDGRHKFGSPSQGKTPPGSLPSSAEPSPVKSSDAPRFSVLFLTSQAAPEENRVGEASPACRSLPIPQRPAKPMLQGFASDASHMKVDGRHRYGSPYQGVTPPASQPNSAESSPVKFPKSPQLSMVQSARNAIDFLEGFRLDAE